MKKIILSSLLLLNFNCFSQLKFETNVEGSNYKFKLIKDLEATKVQSQDRTSTCWSFSALSFLVKLSVI